MPPKKSKQKKEKGKEAVADGKDQLWDRVMALREELEQMKKQKNYFRHERDNIMVSWENSKRLLEQYEAQRRERVRVKEREKHLQDQIEQVHTQLARVNLEHYNAISELKIQAVASQCRILNEFMERELALYQKREAQQAALLEKNSNVDKCLKATMLKQVEEIMEMKYEYDHIHKQKQRVHLEKCQETMSEHAQLLDKEMCDVFEELAAKGRLRYQDVRIQWRFLSDRTESWDKKKKAVQPSVHEESISLETPQIPVHADTPPLQ